MQCKLEANEDREFHLVWEIVLMYFQILKTDINRNISREDFDVSSFGWDISFRCLSLFILHSNNYIAVEQFFVCEERMYFIQSNLVVSTKLKMLIDHRNVL